MSEDGVSEPTEEPTEKQTAEPPTKPTGAPTTKPVRVEVLEKMSTLIAAAFGFVAAFAWNETFKTVLLSGVGDEIRPMALVGYALFVTVLAVFVTIVVGRATAKAKRSLQ